MKQRTMKQAWKEMAAFLKEDKPDQPDSAFGEPYKVYLAKYSQWIKCVATVRFVLTQTQPAKDFSNDEFTKLVGL